MQPGDQVYNPLDSLTERSFEPDICANKHGGNAESSAAHGNLKNMRRDRDAIYEWFVERGASGGTREACLIDLGMADADGRAFHGGYPRCSELLKESRLYDTGRRGKTVKGNTAGILAADVYRPAADLFR